MYEVMGKAVFHRSRSPDCQFARLKSRMLGAAKRQSMEERGKIVVNYPLSRQAEPAPIPMKMAVAASGKWQVAGECVSK